MSLVNMKYIIMFHGNCIDGWFSAYIAYEKLKHTGNIQLYPISPSQMNTWARLNEMKNAHILLLDVSVEEKYRRRWTKYGALSITCIDHHPSSIDHWSPEECPININKCATYLTWERFCPGMEVPFWIHIIDRIDRWDNPTYEDRCVREILNIIAHKPVQKKMEEAFLLTELFITNISNPLTAPMILNEGKTLLDTKDQSLIHILSSGAVHTITPEYINGWNLPNSWIGKNVFVIDNTNITLDSTEASHVLFQYYPQTDVFINYRKKICGSHKKEIYMYSARSREFDLISDNSILKGHKTSAGATITADNKVILPFIVKSV